jgi:flavin-dependent dehydrogenase
VSAPGVRGAEPPDILIVGAGPAGSGAARLLAAWGHRVIVVDRPRKDERALAESIPPSAKKVLSALGMLTAIEDAGFLPWQGNAVWWSPGSDAGRPRVESFPAGVAGFQVVRRDFDARLRALAAESGAAIESGVVREVTTDPPRARIEADGQTREISAAMVLDCSGRNGVVARQGLRRLDESRHTVALVGIWRMEKDLGSLFPDADEKDSRGLTLVAAQADGWAWSVPVAGGLRYITVMVDPQRTALARGVPAADVYLEALARVRAFEPLTSAGSLVEGPWGADASGYCAERYSGPGFLLVGDAASFIDPLSSFGVKKALASAWLAAIVSHTSLIRPAMKDAALAFFDRRERAIYLSARQQASAFAADAAAQSGHPFWIARADTPEQLDPGAEVDAAALAGDPAVLAAFQDLRARPAVHFRTSDGLEIRPRAAVRGREIVLEDHVFLPDWPEGVRYIRDVDLVSVLRHAPRFSDAGEIAEAYVREHGPVALPDLLGAIATLIAKGALVYG